LSRLLHAESCLPGVETFISASEAVLVVKAAKSVNKENLQSLIQ
jgi:hypothetical protein